MAKSQSNRKKRIIESFIVAFAILTLTAMAIQIGINVSETIDNSASSRSPVETVEPELEPTSIEPTPTLDIAGMGVGEFDN